MIILPAIDIKDGNCVRLFKGDFSTVEKVAADYMETAKGFEAAGASWIHMVDLDGAKEGRPVNQHIYEDVAAKTGAAMFATRTGVPLVPIYIQPRKRLFRRNVVVIGEPYIPTFQGRKPTAEELDEITGELMRRIHGLEVKA